MQVESRELTLTQVVRDLCEISGVGFRKKADNALWMRDFDTRLSAGARIGDFQRKQAAKPASKGLGGMVNEIPLIFSLVYGLGLRHSLVGGV
jgi:hypothetical protein